MGKTYYKQELIILVLKKFTYQNIIISKYISKYHYKNIISNKTLFKVIRNARCTEARCFRFNQTDLTFDATFVRGLLDCSQPSMSRLIFHGNSVLGHKKVSVVRINWCPY